MTRRCDVIAAAAAILCAVLIGAGLAAAAEPQFTSCGHVDGTVAISARHLGCAPARSVARSYLRGDAHPQAYHCRRVAITVANGWYALCTKHRAVVQITPE
jgi:hypothetical protein